MKSLSRNEMKNVKGGGPIIPGCNYGSSCLADVGKWSVCGNVWSTKQVKFICGCAGAYDPELGALACPSNS